MTGAGHGVSLSRWYARLGPEAGAAAGAGESPDELRCGPLTVLRSGEGCQIERFGPGRASLALFDGYLLDRDLLGRELMPEAPQPGAAELIAAAYRRWGAELFAHLDGGFLAAVWDAEERRLLAGHDGLSLCPLYYAQRPDGLWFGPNVLELARGSGVERHPNRLSLALRLLIRWPLAGETFFAEVGRARPGHYLEARPGAGLREVRYWQPVPDGDEEKVGFDEAHRRFVPAFERAVERCLEVGARGVMLSGGLDSVTVAAVAAAYGRAHGLAPLTACCGKSPPGYPSTYEEEMQDRVTERLGMPLLAGDPNLWLGGRALLPATLEVLSELPSPTNVWWTASYMGFYRHAADRGLPVLMTGSGGDEWLGVHDSYAADLIRALAVGRIVRLVRAVADTGGRGVRRAAYDLLLRNGVGRFVGSLWAAAAPAARRSHHRRAARRSLPQWFCPDRSFGRQVVETLAATVPIPDLTEGGRIPRRYYDHSVRAIFNRNPAMAYELERRHHVTSLCGVRLISPYLQRDLVDLLTRMSPEALLQASRTKALLRSVAAEHLPGLELEDQRKLHGPPAETFVGRVLRRELAASWRSVGCERLAQLGLVEPDLLSAAVRDLDRQPIGRWAELFTVLSAESWIRAHCA